MVSRIVCCLTLFGAVALADRAASDDASSRSKDGSSLVIVLGGDLGLGGSRQPINAKGGYRHGKLLPWATLTKGISPLLNGDINFANLETVVTDKQSLSAADKLFTFQMHANGVRHLVKTGFNVLSTANNHSRDYGQIGMRETLRHLGELQQNGLLAFPGLGAGRTAAIAPSMVALKGSTIAISALGIGGVSAGRESRRIGQPSYRSTADFGETVSQLASATADYRILSAHYGRELSLRPSSTAMRKLRDEAARENNIDLVVGHHTHVAGGIQRVGRKVILYGLGNLLHLGMQDMAKFGQCRDFGLVVRLHLQRDPKKRLRAAAIEAIPLTRMHAVAEPRGVSAAAKRIAVLNGLAGELDHKASGAQGVRFKVNSQGHGVYCFPAIDGQSTNSLAICKDQATRLRDVGVVRCPRLSNSVLARSSRNRSERKKLRRRTARNAARTRVGVRDPFSGSGFGD